MTDRSARTATAEVDWPALLDRALRGEGVRTVFQPVVDLARGIVVGYEALTRFDGPVTNPEEWFDAARRHGLSAALQAQSLVGALGAREHLPPSTFLAVNVGPDVIDQRDVVRAWNEQPDLSGVVVELTEDAPIESYDSLRPALDRLRAAGALIAIDDAGAGYAGLQHLLGVRPQIIKLDRALVSGIDRDETKRALVEMIGTFASRIDAWVLAEGIEHLGELDTVVGLGVPLAQGYLLARPGPPWPDLDRRGRALLRFQQPAPWDRTLRQVLERATTVADEREAADLFALPGHDPGLDMVVVVDEQDRPVATVDLGGLVHSALDASTRVGVDTTVEEAAARAVTRPADQRFRPLLCVDDAGRLAGVVRMERVLTYLAAHTEAAR